MLRFKMWAVSVNQVRFQFEFRNSDTWFDFSFNLEALTHANLEIQKLAKSNCKAKSTRAAEDQFIWRNACIFKRRLVLAMLKPIPPQRLFILSMHKYDLRMNNAYLSQSHFFPNCYKGMSFSTKLELRMTWSERRVRWRNLRASKNLNRVPQFIPQVLLCFVHFSFFF